MSFAWPFPLKKGEGIEVIAPAFGCSEDILAQVKQFLLSFDLHPLISENIFGKDILCSQKDEIRFRNLYEAFESPRSRYIWCLRGGYGCTRLLPFLMNIPTPSTPKLLIGSSDITALHIFVNQQWGWPSLHAPHLKNIVMKEISEGSVSELKNLLSGTETTKQHNLIPLNKAASEKQSITAPIIGGNLTLVESSLGTFWQVETLEKILFLEEIDERGYHIDRSLVHLCQADLFKKAKAVILGDFIGGTEKDGNSLIEPVLQRFADSLSIPVFKMAGIGHGFVTASLPLGIPVILETGQNLSLSYQL